MWEQCHTMWPAAFFITVHEFFKYFAGWIALKLLTPLSGAFKPHFYIQFPKRITKRTIGNIKDHNINLKILS